MKNKKRQSPKSTDVLIDRTNPKVIEVIQYQNQLDNPRLSAEIHQTENSKGVEIEFSMDD